MKERYAFAKPTKMQAVQVMYRHVSDLKNNLPMAREPILALMDLLFARPPKAAYTLKLLSTLCEDHPIFKRGYSLPKF